MLELRYNGCADCLHTATALLRNAGYFKDSHYRVEFHGDHKKDKIYSKRPDYISHFSGAIIYNPKTESWIDFYSDDHSTCLLCKLSSNKLSEALGELSGLK